MVKNWSTQTGDALRSKEAPAVYGETNWRLTYSTTMCRSVGRLFLRVSSRGLGCFPDGFFFLFFFFWCYYKKQAHYILARKKNYAVASVLPQNAATLQRSKDVGGRCLNLLRYKVWPIVRFIKIDPRQLEVVCDTQKRKRCIGTGYLDERHTIWTGSLFL